MTPKIGDEIKTKDGWYGTIKDYEYLSAETLRYKVAFYGWSEASHVWLIRDEFEVVKGAGSRCTCGMYKVSPQWADAGSHSSWCDIYPGRISLKTEEE